MKTIFIMSFAANIALSVVSLVVLPERVAIHFGANGMADSWAPNYINTLIMTGTEVLIFFSFYYSSRLMMVFPKRLINLPNKDYWLQPERLPQTKLKINSWMYRFGTACFLFFLAIGALTIDANLSNPVAINLTVFFTCLGLFLAYTIWWIVEFYRDFRVPKS